MCAFRLQLGGIGPSERVAAEKAESTTTTNARAYAKADSRDINKRMLVGMYAAVLNKVGSGMALSLDCMIHPFVCANAFG